MLSLLHLTDIPKHIVIFHAKRIKKHQAALCRDILMTVTEIQTVKHTCTRIAHMHKIIAKFVEMRKFRQLFLAIDISPCYIELQCLLNTEVGIVKTLIHTSSFIESFRFMLQYITCKEKPLRQHLIHSIRPCLSLRHFILNTQRKNTTHTYARGPPVMSHRIQRVYACRFHNPVAKQRFHTKSV